MCFLRKQGQAARPTSSHETEECLGPISHIISISMEIFSINFGGQNFDRVPSATLGSVPSTLMAATFVPPLEPPGWGQEHGFVPISVSASPGVLNCYHSTEVTVMASLTVPKGELRLCALLCTFPFLFTSSHLERRF